MICEYDETAVKKKDRFSFTHLFAFFVILIALLIIVSRLWTNEVTPSSFQWDEKSMTITDPAGGTYELVFTDITSMDLKEVRNFGTTVSGMDMNSSRWGIWNSREFGNYHLYMQKSIPVCIVIKTSSGITVINMESKDVTNQLYDLIAKYRTGTEQKGS